MQHDAWFFLGIFVFIFLIWIATGGPTSQLAFSGPTLAQPEELGGGTYLSFPRAPFGVGGTYIRLPGSSEGGGAWETGWSGQGQASGFPSLEGIDFGAPSPYRGIVSMSAYVTSASSSNVRSEYVEIRASENAGRPVNISNWQLVSEVTGKAAVIPRGVVVPTSGIVNALGDIMLAPGERAYINSGPSPIGVSFRENKCTGYLTSFQNFSPPLPQNCPTPEDEYEAAYGPYYIRDTSCIEYVNTLPRCGAVLSPSRKISSACRDFVTARLNYNGCVRAHQHDTNFDGDTWHIFLGRSKYMWRAQYEVVKLWDASGQTVDAFSY